MCNIFLKIFSCFDYSFRMNKYTSFQNAYTVYHLRVWYIPHSSVSQKDDDQRTITHNSHKENDEKKHWNNVSFWSLSIWCVIILVYRYICFHIWKKYSKLLIFTFSKNQTQLNHYRDIFNLALGSSLFEKSVNWSNTNMKLQIFCKWCLFLLC